MIDNKKLLSEDEMIENFEKMLIDDVGVISNLWSLEEYRDELKQKLDSVNETISEKKHTHMVEMNFRTGLTITLESDEKMFERFSKLCDKLNPRKKK